ncbi:helix-turn-helix transcriptional regulator [Ramlibacter sp. WS9]|nr:helix-turn-helix transcriptional regulator [Ramlibacter sp. WS9]
MRLPSTGQIMREALCEQVARASSAKVVLVRAPAGFGKTTAMLQSRERLEAAGIETAWLTLDDADNDRPRFLACIGRALEALGAEPSQSEGKSDIAEVLAGLPSPFALFLDDFETLREPTVLTLVRDMIAHLPRRGQLIIGTRSLPDISLGRLRAKGDLVEIDSDHLRFSLEETAQFLKLRCGEPISADGVGRLHRKTEGWVAALWLVAMALGRRSSHEQFIERFSGTTGSIAEYLADDVLNQQPSEIRRFLLRTSVLRHLNASVCQAVNPHADCARILSTLESANLFLTPVSGEALTYRYHSLFADFLRGQLAREHPDDVARLHLAASGWYESQGRPVPAIDHAIEGGDYNYALTLLAEHAEPLLEQGRMRLLERWFTAIPEKDMRAHPRIFVIWLWASGFTIGPWVAMERMESSGLASSDDPVVQAHLNALPAVMLEMQDRGAEAYTVGHEGLARLPTCRPFADTVLVNAMAEIVLEHGEPQEARRLLSAARQAPGDSAFNRMFTDSVEGVLDLEEGRMRQATARFRMALGASERAAYNPSNGNAWAGVLYTVALYEANELDEVGHLLNVYLPVATNLGSPDHAILCHWLRSRVAFYQGDIDRATQTLMELEYLGHQRRLPRLVASARLERARLLLLQGNDRASKEEMDRADDPAIWQRVDERHLLAHDLDYMAMARLRWQVAFGDAGAALPLLADAIFQAAAGRRHRRVLKLRVLQSLALERAGESTSAVSHMSDVLRQASREGFVRLLLDEGPAIGPVIYRCHLVESANPHADPLMTGYLEQLLAVLGPAAAWGDAGRAPESPIEPLTGKEMRVLQLLAEGYGNSAIGEKLFVSDSTVRTHLRNINMKLNAQSRTHAVAIARRLGLTR